MACLRSILLVLCGIIWLPNADAHGWASILTESGERIESRNSANWKRMSQGGRGYPNPHGMSQTGSQSRPMYCGGNGQGGSSPMHDLISAPDALERARKWKLPTLLQKGSNFTLENWITANHGGVAALYYSCPADDIATPEGYKAVDWKLLTPKKNSFPANKRNGVGFSDKMPEWFGWAGGVCDGTYEGGVLEDCDDCQLQYGGPEVTASWKAQYPPNGAPIAHKPLRINIEYQLPADFECNNAVFSWIWQTPHMCFPKEVSEKGATADFFQTACKKSSLPAYGACSDYWTGEIFNNCIDAQVGDFDGRSSTTSTTTICSAHCECVRNPDCFENSWCQNEAYIGWCAQQGPTSCPSPYCVLVSASSTTDGVTIPRTTATTNSVPTQKPMTSQTTTVTTKATCESCVGGGTCIWTDGQCYRVGEALCKTTPGNVWCGASVSTPAPTSTKTTTQKSATSTTPDATTTAVVIDTFQAVDGGEGRACRGASSGDNSASYYTLQSGIPSLEDCKAQCLATPECKGIEHSSAAARCEVWTRSAGIQASRKVAGFTCLRYTGTGLPTTTTTTTMIEGAFKAVDGGKDRACRGENSGDNSADYYTLQSGIASLEDCKARCSAMPGCKGIEYSGSAKRCEVWTKPDGIQASRAVVGFTCLRYTRQLHCQPVLDSGATEEVCNKICGIIPGQWPCSSDGPCICDSTSLSEIGHSHLVGSMRLRGRVSRDLTVGLSWMQHDVTQARMEL